MNLHTVRDDQICTVRVEGRIVLENQGELRAELEKLIDEGCQGIALDFEEVEYMDSSALGCCAAAYKLIRAKDGALAVFAASPAVEKLWKMIHLDKVIPLCADRQEAVARLQGD